MTSYRFNRQRKLQFKLFKVARAGDLEQMYGLILQGADPFIPDKKGKIAAQYAALAPRKPLREGDEPSRVGHFGDRLRMMREDKGLLSGNETDLAKTLQDFMSAKD